MADTGIVERVAKAIYEDHQRRNVPAHGYFVGGEQWRLYLPEARAAIEAMREPTEAMQAAKDDIDMSAGTDGIWPAMIDTALSPKG